ncbi:MAG: hypothetical protein Q8906_11040 [Bacillota bacterium]|nr:hypothetical protein [Bacillota bacterium]
MQRIEIKEKTVSKALFQFIFPFSIKSETETDMVTFMQKQGFNRFRLDQLEDEQKYYGRFSVSHRDMEAYYLPFTNKVLFPHTESQKGFQRYSKKVEIHASLKTERVEIPFVIHSLDMIICPYQLGFLTIRTEIRDEGMPLSHAIEFAARFRVLEPRTTRDHKTVVEYGGNKFSQVENFLFDSLYPGLPEFFERESMKGAYFETFPFFEDERMYVQSLISLKESEILEEVDVFRAGDLNGLNKEGKAYVNSNNMEYIQRYLKQNGYDRWAPNTYYLLDEHSFACISNENRDVLNQLASQIYGEFYYGLILNLFHKIVLLKMANDYSEIEVERDSDKIEELIHSINSFTANFFFLELATQSHGREIFVHLRKIFQIDALYEDARQTLNSLYKYKEQISSKQNSILLLILTLYTVVSGIFGMNQVIEDLKGKIKWEKLLHYNLFEYFALFTTFTGLITTVLLGTLSLIKWYRDRQKRKKWSSLTVLDPGKK